MATQLDKQELHLQEQFAKIRKLVKAAVRDAADIDRMHTKTMHLVVQANEHQTKIERIRAETRQRDTQTKYEPLRILLGTMTAGAAFLELRSLSASCSCHAPVTRSGFAITTTMAECCASDWKQVS